MVAKLYPPSIAGTIPAFCGTSIEVPFSMNRAVSASEFNGFALKIKKVSGTLIGTIIVENASAWLEKKAVTFDLSEFADSLKIGEFYKVQLAYVRKVGSTPNIGLYSTIGVVKYTTSPTVMIEHLNSTAINNHLYSYSGIYRQYSEDEDKPADSTEKLYSSRFVLLDRDNNIIKDSGEILHNTTYDTTSYEATESFIIPDDLELDTIYYMYYIATTVNGMVKESPRYRITQRRQIPMNLKANLKATFDYDSGTAKIYLVSEVKNKIASGQFLLSRKGNQPDAHWEELLYFSLQSEIPDRLLFTDYTVEQGITYTYSFQQYNENGIYSERSLSNSILADFEDLFLFDGAKQLKVKFNPKVTTFKPTVVETKTNTLGSKHPFITRNAKVDYKELAISGLISYQMDDIQNFMPLSELGLECATYNLITENIKAEREFKLKVMEWLNDGQPKLFRSPTEGNYIVRLMNVAFSPTDTLGRMLHTFSCNAYEIDNYSYENLIKYGLMEVADQIRYQMRWATIELHGTDVNTGKISYFHGQINTSTSLYGGIVRPVYYVSVTDMTPGTYFLLGESEDTAQRFYIGATGGYEVTTETPYNYLGIPAKDDFGNDVQWEGSITYGFKSQITSLFDLISNVQIDDIPCKRLYGPQEIFSPAKTTSNMYTDLEDIKTSILTVNYVHFYNRGYYPIYVDDMFDPIDKRTWNFYLDAHNATYYSDSLMQSTYLEEWNPNDPIDKNLLTTWNLYKILYRRKEEFQSAGEEYYEDRNPFTPYTGYYYDPATQQVIKDDGKVFFVNVNGEEADISESDELLITGIEKFDTLIIGAGVIADIGYQAQTSTYSFETQNYDVALLKQDYESKLEKYLIDRTTSTVDSAEAKGAYKAFINLLTRVINQYKEENGIEIDV